MDARGEVGIVQRHGAFGLQDEVGKLVGGVAPVGELAADGHGFPMGVPLVKGLGLGADADIDVVGDIEPEIFENLKGIIIGERARLLVRHIEGVEKLVETPVGND